MPKPIIAKQFESETSMYKWMADPIKVAELKKQYSPKEYTAELNLVDKQVIVRKK
jgi:hypothetical protein